MAAYMSEKNNSNDKTTTDFSPETVEPIKKWHMF